MVCNVNIPDVVLPSDAKYLTLALQVKTLKDLDIFSNNVHVSAT